MNLDHALNDKRTPPPRSYKIYIPLEPFLLFLCSSPYSIYTSTFGTLFIHSPCQTIPHYRLITGVSVLRPTTDRCCGYYILLKLNIITRNLYQFVVYIFTVWFVERKFKNKKIIEKKIQKLNFWYEDALELITIFDLDRRIHLITFFFFRSNFNKSFNNIVWWEIFLSVKNFHYRYIYILCWIPINEILFITLILLYYRSFSGSFFALFS